ncbi:hypothetical protein SporoP37_08530 [Sporosarcina sp. P37]|uniref:hypothetical protein n=1 Tax=unclassified Sporosarcina TaxID=2647733 RepID=UPI0009BCF367|nr:MULTISPECIES: hypothetical protein [unclassified Sporosarcina]ARD48185.1 hypothetical protein SporoP33_08075 [Sporosarcina sp. P33]ARK24701.1 hypothetical protein SporoP37_08530 [Sporosarcina sp. P37]PID19858.1 hypothetical protein CSV62_01065 [Sporosarcina sp. P35]
MERTFIDPAELELRKDPDFLRSLNMVGEGAPVRNALNECEIVVKKLEEIENSHGYEKPGKPRSCEL